MLTTTDLKHSPVDRRQIHSAQSRDYCVELTGVTYI